MFGFLRDLVREITGENQRERENQAAFERQWRVADMAYGRKPYPNPRCCRDAEREEAAAARCLRANADSCAMPPNTRGMTPKQAAQAEAGYYRKRSNEPANRFAMHDFAVKAEAFQQMADEL